MNPEGVGKNSSFNGGIILLIALSWAVTNDLFSQTQPASALERAIHLFGSGKLSEAETAFRKLLSEPLDAPSRGKATFNLGLTLQKLGRHDDAIKTFQDLLTQPVNDSEPGSHLMETARNYRPRAQWEIGNSLFAKKDYTAALRAYRTTKEKFPFQSWCGNERAEYEYRYDFYAGLCLDYLGKPSEALQQYYRAAFLERWGYSEPAVHFRIVGIYEEAEQSNKVKALLDEIDADLIARTKTEAEAQNVKITEEQLRQFQPTQVMRRILELRAFAENNQRAELIKLLKARGAVTGPPDDLGNWEAKEAARLLGLTPNQSVPELFAAAERAEPLTVPWIAYALGRCSSVEALGWLKEHVLKEENYWAIRSFVYAISLAGEDGLAILNSIQSKVGGNLNLKVALTQQREGRDVGQPEVAFPKVPSGTRLPVKVAEFH